MRLIMEHGALVVATWLSLDILFVIAWARLHTAEQHFQHQRAATVVVFRLVR